MAAPKTRRQGVIKTITDIKTHNLQAQNEQLQSENKNINTKYINLLVERDELKAEVLMHRARLKGTGK